MRRSIKTGLILAIAAAALNVGGCASDSDKTESGASDSQLSQLSQLKPPPDFDRSDSEAVRRAVENDLKSLEKAGILTGLVDSTAGRVRVLVEDLTPAKKQLLQRRYGHLLDVESGAVRPAN